MDEGADRPDADREAAIVEACAAEPEHDIGNARRFLARAGDDAIHVTNVGWHAFDGRRWREDESGAITRRLAHKAAEAIFREIEHIGPTDAEAEILARARVAADALAAPYDPRTAAKSALLKMTSDRKAWADDVAAGDAVKETLSGRRAARHRHAKSSCGTTKLNAMMQEAAAYRPASVDDMNRDVYAFNVANGTLRFACSGEDPESDPDDPRKLWCVRLDGHVRTDLISKLCPVDYDPAARCPTWDAFLVRVQPSPLMRAYLRRLAGYSMLGLNTEQMIAFFYGIGRNGKSTFIDTLARIFADYGVTLSIDSFAGEDRRGGGEATPDLARLPGARLVSASEPESGVRLKEALIKRLTGGEAMPVRRLHKDFFEFSPQFTLIVSGNHKPVIIGNDDGIWRRIHLIPWNEQIPKDEVDKGLPGKLMAEAQGILRWCVEGALDFLACGGLVAPREILDATEQYREEEDPIGSFIRNACQVTGDDADEEKPLDLYMAYETYCTANGAVKVKDTTFYRRMPDQARRGWPSAADPGVAAQFHRIKTDGIQVYRGIRVREEFRRRDGAHGYAEERTG
ncbi:MAG: phage/plasmid primase, P4 family [Mesorhizobium sp.]